VSITNANAAIDPNAGTTTLSVQEILGRNFQSYEFSRTAYRQFRGEYLLEDGAILRLSQYGRQFFVDVTGQPRIEVRATAPDTFVAIAGNAELVFEQHANGVVSRVLLKRPARG
jgi:hypothetical protein